MSRRTVNQNIFEKNIKTISYAENAIFITQENIILQSKYVPNREQLASSVLEDTRIPQKWPVGPLFGRLAVRQTLKLSVPCEYPYAFLRLLGVYLSLPPLHSKMMLTLTILADFHLQSLFYCHTEKFIASERHGSEQCEGDSICVRIPIPQLDLLL